MKATGAIICLALCSLAAASCASSPASVKESPHLNAPAEYTKVCDVRTNVSEYVGKVIRFHVIYKSDHMFYSYISDKSCGSRKTIDVAHPIRTHGDNSVINFFRDEDERCKKNGATVCPVSVDLDVDALISKQTDGSLLAEFKKVRRYTFF